MLKQLSIKNLAIIDDITIDFEENFNVLSGETGAGKSIIIDAISLVFGARASSEIIAKGKESATIQAVLYLPDETCDHLSTLLDLDLHDECILSRTITINGRNTCKINGMIVPLFTISELATQLIDISGQYESQYLLKSKNHLKLLDAYIESKDKNFKMAYEEAYRSYMECKKMYDEESTKVLDESTLEFLKYKFQELKDYSYTQEDEDQLLQEFKRMQSFEKNAMLIEDILNYFEADDGIESKIYLALKQLSKMANNEIYMQYYDQLNETYINVMDFKENFKHFCKQDQFDPQRLDYLENEITKTNRLKRKYNVGDLLSYKNQLKQEIDSYAEHEMILSKLKKQLKEKEAQAKEFAQQMHLLREQYATILANEVMHELDDLYLNDAIFEVKFESCELNNDGMDKVEFFISTNKGVEARPLIKVASGGEVSRIMLGLKSVFTKLAKTNLVIFDEIDTGVSGKVALAMGKKMEAIAKNCQVLAITHLPQVAAMSDHSYYIYKEVYENHTRTVVKTLDEKGKLMEIARLLSGNCITESFISAAQELIISK